MELAALIGVVFLFLFFGDTNEKKVTGLDTVYDNDDTVSTTPGPVTPVTPPKPLIYKNPFDQYRPQTKPYNWLLNFNPYKYIDNSLDGLAETGLSSREVTNDQSGNIID